MNRLTVKTGNLDWKENSGQNLNNSAVTNRGENNNNNQDRRWIMNRVNIAYSNIKYNKKKANYGVVISTDFGLVVLKMNEKTLPTKNSIKTQMKLERELELRRQHLPFNSYCMDKNKETKRITIETKFMNAIRKINDGDYEVVNLNAAIE